MAVLLLFGVLPFLLVTNGRTDIVTEEIPHTSSNQKFEIVGPQYIRATLGKTLRFVLELQGVTESQREHLTVNMFSQPEDSQWNSSALLFTWTPQTLDPAWLVFVGQLDGSASVLNVKVSLCVGCVEGKGKCDYDRGIPEEHFTIVPCLCFQGWEGNTCDVKIDHKEDKESNLEPPPHVECPDPPRVANSRHAPVKNDIVLYYCDNGDKRVTQLQCINGKWEGEVPVCEGLPLLTKSPKNCTSPPRIPHGTAMNSGGIIEYSCKSKYKLSGKRYITCEDGRWEPDPPICELDKSNFCQKPKPILHGSVILFNATAAELKHPSDLVPPGTYARYICDEIGYGIRDFKAYPPQKCKSGRWKGIVPQCELLKCRQPIEPIGGNYRYLSNVFDGRPGTVVQFECFEGYTLIGPEQVTCTEKGVWDGDFPRCLRKSEMCSAPLSPTNGYFKCTRGTCRGYHLGTRLHFFCVSGYEPRGRVIIECEEGGRWSGPGPVCYRAGTSFSPVPVQDDNEQVHPDVDLSTITIVVATCCSILGVLVLVMIAVAFQRCQKSPRFCSPTDHPPPNIYQPPQQGNVEEHDRVALIAFVDGMHVPVPNNVALPSYEEATRGQINSSRSRQLSHPPIYSNLPNTTRPPPDYRLMPNHHAALRVSRTDSIHSTPAFRDGAPDHHRNSIITMGSNATRDNMSEVLGSMDTVNVSDGTSTTATVGTVGSSISNASIALSHRAVAGSLLSSDGSLAITEDAPLLDPSDKDETRSSSRSETSDIQAKDM